MEWVAWSVWNGVCEMECVGMEGVWVWDGVYIEIKHAWDGVCGGWDEGVEGGRV